MILRLFNIITFIFCLVVLSVDFWSVDLYGMEGMYYVLVCILLLILLALHIIQPAANILNEHTQKGFKIFFHLVLIGITLFNFKLIFIVFWGLGYMGTSTPPVFYLSVLANLLALISGASVFLRKYKLTK